MPAEVRQFETERGDIVTVTLITSERRRSTILVTIDDADDNVLPTAELTLAEAERLADELGRLRGRATGGRP